MSLIEDLNDNCFVLATKYLKDLSQEVEDETGQKPTLDEMCELLAWGFKGCSSDILADIDPRDVVKLKAVAVRRPKVKLTRGDIVAIPASNGEYFLVVFLAKTIGYAFGIVEGTHRITPIADNWNPKTLKYAVYSDDRLIREGRWRIVGRCERLCERFPDKPNLYLDAKKNNLLRPEDPTEYGVALVAEGYRHVSKREAEEIGLLSGDYKQFYDDEEFEEYLERTMKPEKKRNIGQK
jgi:hypothetical protein